MIAMPPPRHDGDASGWTSVRDRGTTAVDRAKYAWTGSFGSRSGRCGARERRWTARSFSGSHTRRNEFTGVASADDPDLTRAPFDHVTGDGQTLAHDALGIRFGRPCVRSADTGRSGAAR